MNTFRAVVLALVMVAPIVIGAAAAATGTRAQTVTITTAAPQGKAAIWDRSDGLGNYVPRGTATSGLPVYFSASSPNDACYGTPGALGYPNDPGAITIYWNSPGTCIVTADQRGNAQHAAAPSVTQTFTIEKEITHVTAPPVSKHGSGVSPSTFTTTLLVETQFGSGVGEFPLPSGEVINVIVGGKVICSAATDDNGVATCTKPIGSKNWLRIVYTVAFAGDAFSAPSSMNGRLH